MAGNTTSTIEKMMLEDGRAAGDRNSADEDMATVGSSHDNARRSGRAHCHDRHAASASKGNLQMGDVRLVGGAAYCLKKVQTVGAC